METGTKRVSGREDASITDASEFPLIAEQRPLLHFVGVEISTRNVDPQFHSFNRPSTPGKKLRVKAIEILDQVIEDDEDFLFVHYEDGSIKKVETRPFITVHRTLMDSFLDQRAKGKLLPFDRTEPYVHPVSRTRNLSKIKISRKQLDSLGNTSESGSAPENAYKDNGDDDNDSAEEEPSSESYEEDDEPEPVRRSVRQKHSQKQTKLPFGPRETRAFHNSRSMRRHRAPETSESDEGDEDGEDSDVQIIEKPSRIQPKRSRQMKTTAQDTDEMDDAPSAPKRSVQRKPRVVNQALGSIRQAEDDDYLNLFERHQPHCSVCSGSPAHLIVQQQKKKATAFTKKGGWIQCIQCTDAVHWACLQPRTQDEILRAVKAHGQTNSEDIDDLDEESTERNDIKYSETTDFLCAYCTQNGACFECKKPLEKPKKAVTATAKDIPPNTDTVMVPAEQTSNGADAQSLENDSVRPARDLGQESAELWFRCIQCHRAAHYAHLKSPWIEDEERELDSIEEIAEYYQEQWGWLCDDCSSLGDRAVDKILAWRPFPSDAPIESAEVIVKKMKDAWPREYLVKWEGKSYRWLNWVPHSWMSSRAYQKLRHFTLHGSKVKLEHLGNAGISPEKEEELARRRLYEEEDGPPLPNARAEECVPDPWKTIDQVLDVRFLTPATLQKIKGNRSEQSRRKQFQLPASESDDDVVEISKEDTNDEGTKENTLLLPRLQKHILFVGVDLLEHAEASKIETPLKRKRRAEPISESDIDDVVACYVKWGDLEYQEATWDIPPERGSPSWAAWEAAFSRFIQAQSVFVAKTTAAELEKRDSRDPAKFAKNNMKLTQSFVHDKGMKLRPFQLDGVNWLLYQWWRLHPAILADEMGLGKTVQIITFLAKLVEKKIWPHLVVVPNSTILNWMREFQTWAPNIRAVPYYGEQSSRKIIRSHEIFHSSTSTGQTKLKLHVLVTTYETFINHEEWATVFKAPSRWEVLIVDEGQRLKNNNSLLFQRLNTINIGHRVLMTGTPLNNNIRELLNLMNFVDPEQWDDLNALERVYHQDTLTPELVAELHEKLKEYFLRRTKEILKLPGKHEIIVPISLSKLQKSVYKSLIESNLSLLSGLINTGSSSRANAKVPKTNLRNILMQTRKCCQHPYLVEENLEVQTSTFEETHRQLIDASGKLKFLKIMLAKLKSRGRRVLLFSQFVIALDIIEDFIVGEGYKFLRLDGDLKSSLRQKDIDKYNAPGSDYFIYLLSTRAGGVGINLATADTVIVFDPDFNPHQDAQAVARAHRFGQKKDVIVFRLMAKLSPEEKIMAAGKKKLLLDHVIVQNMEDEEPIEDLTSMLLSGAKHLFDGHDENDIIYTESMVESLIDDAEVEAAKAKDAKTESAGLTFEFAQIWDNANQAGDNEGATEIDTDFWAQMIAKAQEEKEKAAAQEVAASGRGAQRKAKAIVTTYQQLFEDSPEKKKKHRKSKSQDSDKEYTFKGVESSPSPSEAEPESAFDILGDIELPSSMLHSSSARPSTASQNQIQVQKREPVCTLCDTRHGENECQAIQTLEGSRRLRLLLLAGNDSPEDKQQALWYLEEHIARLEVEEAKRNALVRQTALQQATPRTQQARNTPFNHSNSVDTGVPRTSQTSRVSGPSSSSAISAEQSASAPVGTSRSNSSADLSMAAKKRPLDDSSDTSRPFKKANTGVRPQFCYLCNLPFHPVVECKIMNSDAITMQRRLQQLEAQLNNPEVAPYINALRNQYNRKVKQATRPR